MLRSILVFLSILVASTHAAPASDLEFVDVFTSQDGFPDFRICSLVATPRGTLIAITEGRQSENDWSENKLVGKRSTDHGRTWSKLQILVDEGKAACNDASVVVTQRGRILALYSVYPAGVTEFNVEAGFEGKVCRECLVFSDDDGLTWSQPTDLTRAVKRPEVRAEQFAPGTGICLRQPPHAGRLVVPLWQKYRGGTWVAMALSDDDGKTWKLGEDVPAYAPDEPKRGASESQIVELTDGRILLTGRSWDSEPLRKSSVSSDGGATWSRMADDPVLIDPHCEASILRYSDSGDGHRSRILFSNPADPKKRIKGTIRLSYDEGATWPISKVIAPGLYGYSSLAALPDGTICCLCEDQVRGYWRIKLARLTLAWLTDGKDLGN